MFDSDGGNLEIERYHGKFYEDQYHGYGEWSDLINRYRGEYQNGLKHGDGLFSTNKYTYEGPYKQNAMHGKGKITYRDGRTFEGHFVHDVPQGHGRLTSLTADRSLRIDYEGQFINGLPVKH